MLAARGDHRAAWRADDALAVGLTPSRATESFRVVDLVSVALRKARFREEAFHGPDTKIVVVTAERSITEFCVLPEEVAEVGHRLDAAVEDRAGEPGPDGSESDGSETEVADPSEEH